MFRFNLNSHFPYFTKCEKRQADVMVVHTSRQGRQVHDLYSMTVYGPVKEDWPLSPFLARITPGHNGGVEYYKFGGYLFTGS